MIFRLASYAFAAAVFTEALVRGAYSGRFTALGSEGGPIEHAHYGLCGAAAFLFACASRRSGLSDIFAVMAYGAVLGLIREADAMFDHLAFHGAYKIPAAIVGALVLSRAYRARTTLTRQLGEWMTMPSFAVTAGGAFIVLVYAQIVGQKELWQGVMGDSYIRPVKDVAEELQEMGGYLLIFFGALESCVWAIVSGRGDTIATNPGLDRNP
jgi:hypothetical protein